MTHGIDLTSIFALLRALLAPRSSRRIGKPVHDKPLSEAPARRRSPRSTAWWSRRRRIAARIGVDILKRGRQCGGRRGRDRLRARGHLSARRQYRRRRLHGDPARQGEARRSPSIIARWRRPRSTRDSSSMRRQCRPAEVALRPGSAIGVPGTVAGLALAHAQIRLRQVHAGATDRTGDRARARRLRGRRRSRRHLRVRASRCSRAGRRRRR